MFNDIHSQFADKPDSLLFNIFVGFFLTSFFRKAFSSWSVIDWWIDSLTVFYPESFLVNNIIPAISIKLRCYLLCVLCQQGQVFVVSFFCIL